MSKAGRQVALAEPWSDTAASTRQLMLAVLGELADVERDLIHTKVVGQHMARYPAQTPQRAAEAWLRQHGGVTLRDLADSYNVSKTTTSRLS